MPHLILGFIFSGIGFVYFTYGRKQSVVPMIVSGVALMAYPYFVDSIPWLIGVGVALALLPRVWR